MNKKMRNVVMVIASLMLLFISIYVAIAEPNGAQITYNSTVSGQGRTPENRTDPRGTITTLVLDGVQQDQHWKAYVGNVSGVLTLDDGDGYTIYDWDLTGLVIQGEVYATRATTDFSSIVCANLANITAEETFHNMTAAEKDSISSTFNYTTHKQFYVGSTQFAQNACSYTTATYINGTRQNVNTSSFFQEILLQDANSNIVFTTIIEDNVNGYRIDSSTYDFQMIVPESDIKASPTTYYFYTEIES